MLRHIWTNATFRTRLAHSIKRRANAGLAELNKPFASIAS
jgi:hypothetical protein